MNDQQLYELLAKKLAGEASAAELQRLDDWIAQSPDNRAHYQQLLALWQLPALEQSASEQAFERLMQRIDTPSGKTRTASPWRPRWVAAAAVAAVLIVGFLGYMWYGASPTAPELAQRVTPKGTRTKIQLPDGSMVWLNADSRLEYPQSFDGATREVSLVGEAFFDVVKNPAQPFVIKLKTGSIRVLGTSFNVKAYPNDSIVETAVVTGRVAFIPNRTARKAASSDTLFILPNHKVVQDLQTNVVLDKPTVAALNHAWMDDKLVFMDTPLSEVARTLERRYGIAVVLERESLSKCPLTATFDRQSLKEVMELIALTKQFDYQITNNNQFIIKGKGCEAK